MSKNSEQAYNAVNRGTLLNFDPETLVVAEDPNHALYDERVKLPVNEAMVRNIMHHGVLEPVIVRKNPETGKTEIVDGRQRVKNCIEANRRLRDQGADIHLVPAVVRRGDDPSLMGVMVSTNEIREEDSPLNKAAKMGRLQMKGRSKQEIALLFGCGPQTVDNYLSLLDCPEAIRSAVEARKIPVSEAYKLAKLEPGLQKETLSKMLEAAATGGTVREKSRKMREASGQGPQRRTKKEIETYLEKVEEKCIDPKHKAIVAAVLRWSLGGSEPRFPRAAKPGQESAPSDEQTSAVA